MPHYYFHVSNSVGFIKDEEGRTLADLDAVWEHAKQDIRSMLSEELKRGVLDLRGYLEVTDAAGNVALIIPFRDAVELRLDGGEGRGAAGPRESA